MHDPNSSGILKHINPTHLSNPKIITSAPFFSFLSNLSSNAATKHNKIYHLNHHKSHTTNHQHQHNSLTVTYSSFVARFTNQEGV